MTIPIQEITIERTVKMSLFVMGTSNGFLKEDIFKAGFAALMNRMRFLNSIEVMR
jgi:hypothetical protein